MKLKWLEVWFFVQKNQYQIEMSYGDQKSLLLFFIAPCSIDPEC